MAVYTEVSFEQADAFVHALGRGRLSALEGIAEGVENTNYFATSDGGQWVLTLFERASQDELAFCLGWMRHLAQRGLPVPMPQADAAGAVLHRLAGRPAALLERLHGEHVLAPDLAHIEQVGEMLARLHRDGTGYAPLRPRPRGLDWCVAAVAQVLPFLDDARARLLRDELAYQQAAAAAMAALPRGPIHADLFRDNVVFDRTGGEDRLSGLFDFFFAGVDSFGFDIAVCLNDWCSDPASGRLVEPQAQALCAAYARVRPLAGGELRAMPALLRAAGLRFWLSRLHDLHLPRDAALLAPRDPEPFERLLRARIERPWHPPL